MSEVHLLRKHPDENKPGQGAGLPPCPVCGAEAYIHSDTVDGFWFGWSVGCPRFCLNDGIHGQDENTPREEHLAAHGFSDKKSAKKWWKRRVERYGRANEQEGTD